MAFIFISCFKEAELGVNFQEHTHEHEDADEQFTGGEKAIQIFNDFLKDLNNSSETRASVASPTVVSSRKTLISTYGDSQTTRSADPDQELAVYELTLQNADESQGFAVVADDDSVEEVIAYAPYGAIADTTFNKGLALYFRELSQINDYIQSQRSTSTRSDYWQPGWATAFYPLSSTWEFDRACTCDVGAYDYWGPTIMSETAGAFVGLDWNQTAPYNNRVPYFLYSDPSARVRVGCWAVAVGMVMAYHGSPSTYDWDSLLSSSTITPDQTSRANEVSRLLYDIALAGETTYDRDENAGNTSPSMIETGLNRMGYSCETVYYGTAGYSGKEIFEEIKNHYRPVLYVGYCSEGGHMWVVDGVYLRHRYRYAHTNTNGWINQGYSGHCFLKMKAESPLMHCNWGWGGSSNGYYYNFEPFHDGKGQTLLFNSQKYLIKGIAPL